MEPEWIVPTGGTIRSVAAAIRMTTQPGEGIIVQPPVYYRYKQAADRIGRKTIYNPLKMVGGRYEMDFENLEHCMEDSKNRLMILCNPHNPIGQVWSPDHLAKVARLARRYGVTVFSDEIFAETVYNGHIVQPYSEAPDAWEHAIVSTSLGKAFSLTGVNYANLIIPDKTLREAFIAQRNADHYGSIEPLIHAALLSAYTNEGAQWVKEMNDYVLENIRLVRRFFSEHLPQALQKRRRRLGEHLILFPDDAGWRFQGRVEGAETEPAAPRVDELVKAQRVAQPLLHQQRLRRRSLLHGQDVSAVIQGLPLAHGCDHSFLAETGNRAPFRFAGPGAKRGPKGYPRLFCFLS